MFTDIVGYTARAQRDEPQALRFLDEQRRLLRPKFEEHHGREVKTIGDAFLVEFDSALNATGCAVAIQRALYERNLHDPGESIDVRIGIHLGEISHEGSDIHGDAVNVASRVYPLADPGGICLSEPVYAQIRGKLDLAVEKLPPTPLKNVAYPVDLYRAVLPWSERGLAALLPWTDREEEMGTVQKSMDAAVRGEAGVVMLVGEVGIGKTRLADEAIERARKTGVRVLRGRCAPGELAAPYAPWAEAFRQLVRDAPPALLYRSLGSQSREMARLVPEVAEKVGPMPPAPSVEPDQARLQFLEGIGQVLERLSSEGALLVFLDDLHWADPASTLLLRFLVPRLSKRPVLLVGAYRKDEGDENRALREALSELHREHLLTTVTLGRFDAPQVGTLIGEMFHAREVSREFRDLVHARTGGNPLLVEEVLRALVRDKVIYWSGTGWERRPVDEIEIPEGVKEIITQRLRRFDQKAVELLRLASVIGYEFDFDLLAEISGEEEGHLLDLLEALLRGRLVQEVKGSHGRALYIFADHPTRDVLYEEVSLVRRRRLHLKIARAVEGLGEKATRDRLGEIAHHYLEGNDVAKAREFTLKAAERAASVFAHNESYQLYRTAVDLLEEEGDELARARTLRLMGVEAGHLGRGSEARRCLMEAEALYGRLGRPVERALVLIEATRIERETLGDALRAVELGRQAVALLETLGESAELADALNSLGVVLTSTGQISEGRRCIERSIPLAEKFHQVDAASTGFQFLANTSPWTKKEEALALAAQGIRVAEEGDANRLATKFVNNSFALISVRDDARGALENAERGRREAERRGQPMYVRFALAGRAWVLVCAGRWAEARAEAQAAQDLSAEPRRSLDDAISLSTLAILETHTGDLEKARALATKARSIWEGLHSPITAAEIDLALLDRAADEGRTEPELAARLEGTLGTSRARGRTMDSVRTHANVLLALVVVRLRSDATAPVDDLLDELAELSSAIDEPWSRAALARARGARAAARKEYAVAVAELANAVTELERTETPYSLGRTLLGLGEAQALSGDKDGARKSLDRAAAVFERLSAAPARAATERLRASLTG